MDLLSAMTFLADSLSVVIYYVFLYYRCSNFMQDVLLGNDELIDFADFLGGEDDEQQRQPHAVLEKEWDKQEII